MQLCSPPAGSEGSCGLVPVAEGVLLPLRQGGQLWRGDEDRVLAALRFIRLDQPGFLRPVPVHLPRLDQSSKSSQTSKQSQQRSFKRLLEGFEEGKCSENSPKSDFQNDCWVLFSVTRTEIRSLTT